MGHRTKEDNLKVTQKYNKIRAINGDKAIRIDIGYVPPTVTDSLYTSLST